MLVSLFSGSVSFWRTLEAVRTEGRQSLDRCLFRRTVWLS